MSDFPFFNESEACPKCGHDTMYPTIFGAGDVLDVRCGRCTFRMKRRPLDQLPCDWSTTTPQHDVTNSWGPSRRYCALKARHPGDHDFSLTDDPLPSDYRGNPFRGVNVG